MLTKKFAKIAFFLAPCLDYILKKLKIEKVKKAIKNILKSKSYRKFKILKARYTCTEMFTVCMDKEKGGLRESERDAIKGRRTRGRGT